MNEVTKILNDAREILESELNWCQDHLVEEIEGTKQIVSVCALGALDLAACRHYGAEFTSNYYSTEMNEAIGNAEDRLLKIIANEVDEYVGVAGYNDMKTTTKEDVILLFKRAAEMEG